MPKAPKQYLLMSNPFVTTKGTFPLSIPDIIKAFQDDGVSLPLFFDHPEEVDRNRVPAAAFFDVIERGGEIWAVNLRYSGTAKEQLLDGGWAFHSPEFLVRESDNMVTKLLADALVHEPATVAQTSPFLAKQTIPEGHAFMCASASKISVQAASNDGGEPTTANDRRKKMSDAILKALSVVDEGEAIAAITTMKAAKVDSDKAMTAKSAELASAKKAGEADAKMVADVIEATGCDDRDKLLATCAAHKEASGTAKAAGEELAKMKADADEAEKTSLIEAAKVTEKTAEFLKKQALPVVKDFVELHKDAAQVPTGTQSAAAVAAPPRSNEDDAEKSSVISYQMKREGMSREDAEKYFTDKYLPAKKAIATKANLDG